MPLFGFGTSESRSTVQTYNTTNTHQITKIRDIGFTGANGVQALTRTLNLAKFGIDNATELNRYSIQQSSSTLREVAMSTERTLGGLINATRDFAQRAIAGSTGQATPLQSIAAAGEEYSGGNRTLVYIGLLIAAVVVLRN